MVQKKGSRRCPRRRLFFTNPGSDATGSGNLGAAIQAAECLLPAKDLLQPRVGGVIPSPLIREQSSDAAHHLIRVALE